MIERSPEDAYLSDNVIRSFVNSDWFTPAFIEEVQANEPEPERPGLGHWVNKRLDAFFIKQLRLTPDNAAFQGAMLYVTQRLVGPQGHPFQLGRISLFDDEVRGYAKELQVPESWEFDRRMIGSTVEGLLSMIAPEDLRRPVVRVACSYGSEKVKKDVLLWSQLVRKGAEEYATRQYTRS